MAVERIPNTTLDVFPLCLGGNVFGWTADERQSFAVLDAYLRNVRLRLYEKAQEVYLEARR